MQTQCVQEGRESFYEHQDTNCEQRPGPKEHKDEKATEVAIELEAHGEHHVPQHFGELCKRGNRNTLGKIFSKVILF